MITKRIVYGCEAHGNANRKYLVRYTLLDCFRLQICLHVFYSSDGTNDFHDHPWLFISLILWQGYIEETPDGKRRRRWPGMILFRRAIHQHRVELVNEKPAITLVLMGRRKREWYFYNKGLKLGEGVTFRKRGVKTRILLDRIDVLSLQIQP